MSLLADILQTLKQIAMEAVRASHPMDYLYGTVEQVSPMVIAVDQKRRLTGGFLRFTQTAASRTWYAGDKAILLQKPGAQEFLVLDKGA